MQVFVDTLNAAMTIAHELAMPKKRYVQAVLIACIGDMSTGRTSFSEQDALGAWRDGRELVHTILRLGLPEDVPEDAPLALRERAEARRHLLDPTFVVQPWFPEEDE